MARRFLAAALIIFAPIALLGLFSSPNEYRAMGNAGVDCDGPIVVLLFAVPALIVYLTGLVLFVRRAITNRKMGSALVAATCLIVSAGLMFNVTVALSQHFEVDQREVCGPGL